MRTAAILALTSLLCAAAFVGGLLLHHAAPDVHAAPLAASSAPVATPAERAWLGGAPVGPSPHDQQVALWDARTAAQVRALGVRCTVR